MKLTVDARSNSLVLIAPDSLYTQVKSLVEQIDQASLDQAEEFQVVTLKNANPEAVQKALASILQDESRPSSSRTSSSPGLEGPEAGRPVFHQGPGDEACPANPADLDHRPDHQQ